MENSKNEYKKKVCKESSGFTIIGWKNSKWTKIIEPIDTETDSTYLDKKWLWKTKYIELYLV